MLSHIKRGPKIVLGLVVIGGGLFIGSKYLPSDLKAQQTSIAKAVSTATGNGPDLKVSIVSFHGYAPALVANGASLTTQKGSIFDQLGLNVECRHSRRHSYSSCDF